MSHLKDLKMSYWAHFRHAFCTAYVHCVAGVLGFIHAFIPWILKDCMSRRFRRNNGADTKHDV